MLDLAAFVSRLKQVITWTDRLSQGFDFEGWNYGDVFRQLNPVINGQPLLTVDRGYAIWNANDWDVAVYNQALNAAFKQRDAYEAIEASHNYAASNFMEQGRILCYELRVTTNVGDAAIESSCFIDENDAPPIDTWFFLEENFSGNGITLFCWIPRGFEPKMQAAFGACDNLIFGMYQWLDELTPQVFYPQLVAAMLRSKA
jgi:hypothetical protein